MAARTFKKQVRIAPSLLAADFARLKEQIKEIEDGGADWLHVDVMDGVFVPNLSFGAKVIETCRAITKLPLDVHLMVVEPEKYFDTFAKAGANVMTIHVEDRAASSPSNRRASASRTSSLRSPGCRTASSGSTWACWAACRTSTPRRSAASTTSSSTPAG